MGIKTVTLHVEGMTCASCESRIERSLLAIGGIVRAKASRGAGEVAIEYDGSRASLAEAKAAIERAGYTVSEGRRAGTLVALGLGLALVAAYLVASASGLFSSLPKVDATIGYGALFVVGLLTSVHCVAMCGGLSLSQSLSRLPIGPGGSSGASSEGHLARLGPGLLYSGGRIISYTLVGGIVGAIGSAFSFSPTAKGLIMAAAGLLMLLLGLKMLGILRFPSFAPRLIPTAFRAGAGRARSAVGGKGPFAVGLLNGLMPCGPLQTMQLYALGTGSPLAGALSMLVFSLGTTPLMLGFGAASTLLPRRFVPTMVKASAVLVMFLGAVSFARAAALAGVALPAFGEGAYAQSPSSIRQGSLAPGQAIAVAASGSVSGIGVLKAKVEGGVQRVVTEFKGGLYVPFVVQAGVPLKWTVRVTEDDLTGCNNPMVVPSYGIRKTLVPGDNLVEFTPRGAGVIAYSCWMGMVRSRITVVPDLATAQSSAFAAVAPGGGCCGR